MPSKYEPMHFSKQGIMSVIRAYDDPVYAAELMLKEAARKRYERSLRGRAVKFGRFVLELLRGRWKVKIHDTKPW